MLSIRVGNLGSVKNFLGEIAPGCKHFDGSARAPAPPMRDLAKGAFVEFLAMLLFVYFGCGSAASNAHWDSAGEWDSASVTIIAFQFGLGSTLRPAPCVLLRFALTLNVLACTLRPTALRAHTELRVPDDSHTASQSPFWPTRLLTPAAGTSTAQ